MVSDRIKGYTKNEPYELRWRFDFDNSLVSVCNINGEDYDKFHLSDEDKEHIEMAYCYLKSLQAFIKSSDCLTEAQKHELASDDTPSYIDYVNLGWANEDGNTYSSTEYWETSNGVKSFAYEEFDAPLSEEGLFQFGLYTFPCMTRVIENGIVTMDYREQNPHLIRRGKQKMVYVTCKNGDEETFLTWKDAEEFVKENGLNMEEDVCERDL